MHRRGSVGARLVGLVRDVLRVQSDQHISLVASGAAFWLAIAAFPAAVAAVNIFGLVVDQEDIALRLGVLASAGPDSLGSMLAERLDEVARPSPGTLAVDTLLVVVALWGVSRAMRHLLDAIRTAHGLPRRRLLAHWGFAVIAGITAVLMLGVIAYLVSFLAGGSVVALDAAGFVLGVLLVSGLYAMALGRAFRFRETLPGVGVSAVGLVLAVVGFRVYLAGAGDSRELYGALAGVVLTMIAIWVVVYVVLIGAVVNARLRGDAPEVVEC